MATHLRRGRGRSRRPAPGAPVTSTEIAVTDFDGDPALAEELTEAVQRVLQLGQPMLLTLIARGQLTPEDEGCDCPLCTFARAYATYLELVDEANEQAQQRTSQAADGILRAAFPLDDAPPEDDSSPAESA